MQLINSVENDGEKIKQVGNMLPNHLISTLGGQNPRYQLLFGQIHFTGV